MRKVLTFLGASLVIVWAMPVRAQQAPDQFKDVPTDHWAYQAVESLRSKNILIGYPDGYFRGKRTLTRYEFAVALDRALRAIPAGPQGPAGEAGPAGPAGAQGEQGPPGVTPEELANLRRLAEEFRNELTALGNNMAAVNRKLDALAKQVADLETIVRNMPKVYGGAFLGIRADRTNGDYVDRDGAMLTNGREPWYGPLGYSGGDFRNSPVVVHQLQLGVLANIPGGATLDAALTSNTYKNYLGGNTAVGVPYRVQNPGADTYVHHLEINAPFTGLGRGSKLTIGRMGHRVSHLTLWKPEVDTYFDNPFEKDGNIYMDGARLTTNFGSVSAELFAGKTGSVTGSNGGFSTVGVIPGGYQPPNDAALAAQLPGYLPSAAFGGWSAPLAGATTPASFRDFIVGSEASYRTKPIAQTYQGQFLVDELAGISLGLGVRQLQGGHIRFTAIGAAAAGDPRFPGDITNAIVLGSDADLRLADRLVLNAEWGKTIPGTGRFDTVNAHDNNAFNATLGYSGGPLSVSAGYRYIDPLFYAPGYWGRIGNWINPTNVQGPIVRAAYDITPSLGINLGGDFYTAARDRSSQGGLSRDDEITRVLVGLKWGVSKSFMATADWEGVYYKFDPNGALRGIIDTNNSVHPTEHYITLGAGYNLTSNTILKLAYQIGSFDGHRALLSGGLNRYNFNVFTSQVAVKF